MKNTCDDLAKDLEIHLRKIDSLNIDIQKKDEKIEFQKEYVDIT